jgi:hypothetical protein
METTGTAAAMPTATTSTTSKRYARMRSVARASRLLSRRAGPIGIALTAWDIWRRLPPKQRKQVMNIARKHGPKVAARVMKARSRARDRRR